MSFGLQWHFASVPLPLWSQMVTSFDPEWHSWSLAASVRVTSFMPTAAMLSGFVTPESNLLPTQTFFTLSLPWHNLDCCGQPQSSDTWWKRSGRSVPHQLCKQMVCGGKHTLSKRSDQSAASCGRTTQGRNSIVICSHKISVSIMDIMFTLLCCDTHLSANVEGASFYSGWGDSWSSSLTVGLGIPDRIGTNSLICLLLLSFLVIREQRK